MMEIKLGLLTLFGEARGAHVEVRVRGVGPVGSRPLCGQFVASPEEWQSLAGLEAQIKALAAFTETT